MERALALYRSTIGKKVLMALSGVVLFGFLIGHMLGNLQYFLGPEVINAYGASLHESMLLLWGVRVVLLVSLVVHVAMTVQLVRRNAAARPNAYARKRTVAASLAARTMIISGPVIFVFVLFHIAHLTLGWRVVPPDFIPGDMYTNLSTGFRVPWVAVFYVVCVGLVAMHVFHGAWSMFRTIGLVHPRYDRMVRVFATATAIAIGVGFASLPITIVARVVGDGDGGGGVQRVERSVPPVHGLSMQRR